MSDIAGSISAVAANNNQLFKIEDTTKSALSVDSQLADANIVHISKDDYETLVATSATISNTLYIVSSDFIDAYGQQMKNLAAGTELSDAVNLEQLNSLSSKFYQLPADGIPGSDMQLSVQNALEKAIASISSVPSPIDPVSAAVAGQYADALATKDMVSTRISAEIDHQLDVKIPYLIVTPETSGTTSLSISLQDHAINSISANSTITDILLIFPQKTIGISRDFFVRMTITSISSIPTLEFQEQDGSNVQFDIGDDSWANIDGGVNLMLFTETAQ